MLEIKRMPTQEEYNIAKESMTKEEFDNYTMAILEFVMIENQDVFKRLKEA